MFVITFQVERDHDGKTIVAFDSRDAFESMIEEIYCTNNVEAFKQWIRASMKVECCQMTKGHTWQA